MCTKYAFILISRNSFSLQEKELESVKAEMTEVREENTRLKTMEKELESVKAEMTEVREENTRLKTMIQKIEDDYRSLHMRFIDMIQQEEPKNSSSNNNNNNNKPSLSRENIEETESFISLRLGTSPREPKRDDHNTTSSSSKMREEDSQHLQLNESLKLGLDYNLEASKSDCMEVMAPDRSPENSVEEIITKDEEAAGETWPPSKVLKTARSNGGEEEISQQASVKRARVSVRARCDTPTMNDGCQWRKYGQKIAKGNPCPRAYYRCTVAAACPVRKQVQRCAEDMSILITTYEGTHNHPLPVAATAMASTTSAAASMLISGSSTSQPGLIPPAAAAASAALTTNNLHGLNFSLSDNSRARPFHFPNTSSSALPFPTITLDLTSNSTPSHRSNLFSSVFPQSPKYPSNSLSFSTESNMVPTIWGNGYLKNGYNNTNIGSVNFGRSHSQLLDQFNNYQKSSQASSQQVLTETLTKAITSDPSFRSVIAAAISSLAAEGGGNQGGGGESMGQKLKWGEAMQVVSSNPLAPNGKQICTTNYLNHQQPPLPFSLSKNNSKEAAASRDQMN
ncbi:hypothetical protein RHSIM_RhsimUnG0199600 [Rhododendron simsii]|uniref:WRKY domain-containing protein n=1 Tax=Rhododendron simsii TaxID=118357 RepID=A0A834FUE5_RHOSS|nr:hypothetical protein RHSIM_RhsimUnG0199600 [Rhododendron simsii]